MTSGAELKASLTGLGVSPACFAERMGVTMRTVVRWFDATEIYPEAADELEHLKALTNKEIAKWSALIGEGREWVLHTYRTDGDFNHSLPASWHRALTFRLMEQLRAAGNTVRIEYR